MIISRKRAASWSRLRAVSCLLLTISAGLVVLAGIASSRAIDQDGSASSLGAVASAKAAEQADRTNRQSALRMARHRLRCRVHRAGSKLDSAKISMQSYRRHCRQVGLQQMRRVHRRFGSHLIPEFHCRQPIHLQMPRSLTSLLWLAINDSIRPGSFFLRDLG